MAVISGIIGTRLAMISDSTRAIAVAPISAMVAGISPQTR